MFCSVSFGSAARDLAVPGIKCITPIAPFGDTAFCLIADSALATLATNAGGRELRRAASWTRDLGSVGFGAGGGSGTAAAAGAGDGATYSSFSNEFTEVTGTSIIPSLVNN